MDFVRRWSEASEIGAGRFLGWLGVTGSKFYDWRERYGHPQVPQLPGDVPDRILSERDGAMAQAPCIRLPWKDQITTE